MSLLQMSVSAGVMIAVITIIRALTISRLPKKTFSVLWWIVLARLLVPFSWPSPFSIYSLINSQETRQIGGVPAVTVLRITPAANTLTTVTQANVLSMWELLWGTGTVLCTLYFLIAYIRCHCRFRVSQPLENSYAAGWLSKHKCKRPVTIRQTSGISAPLTYGIFRPVILMPTGTDWTDTRELQYVLTHEYVHIRRFDGVTKFMLTVALCVHWLNPLVWVMYILANRDIELSCDEKVVRTFGETIKSAYALALVSMEERKSGLTPGCNNFSKNAIEERIESIMKMRKPTAATLIIMVLLIGCVTTVFATSSIPKVKEPAVSGKGNGTIVYDTVEVRHYSDNDTPYVFWQRTNNTEQSVSNIQFSMLAYDKNGNALSLPWTVVDSSAGYSYDVLCEWEPKNLSAKQQADSADGNGEGGWSLGWTIDAFEKDTPELRELFSQVAYVLCCDKQVTFEDESVWTNPEYNDWLETYKGKKTNVSILQSYYPNECKIK